MTEYTPTTGEVAAGILDSADHDRKVAANTLRNYADTLGVDATEDHDGSEWWGGYRQAQREFIRQTSRLADCLEAGNDNH